MAKLSGMVEKLADAVEEERKYEVDEAFQVPDLAPCLATGGRVVELPPVTLTATYYDTADLRLARAGASLRHRRGDPKAWTVKLPTGTPGMRHEISRSGSPGKPPADLLSLVTAVSRGAPLAPVVTVRTVRRAYELRDPEGAVLAELADDAVAVLDGRKVTKRFREIEVELKGGTRDLLDRAGAALTAAGARAGDFTAKHVRALGAAARRAPDLVPPSAPPGTPPSPPPSPLPSTAPALAGDRDTTATEGKPTKAKSDKSGSGRGKPDKTKSANDKAARSGSGAAKGAAARAADVVTTAVRRHVARILDHDPLVRLRATVGDDDTAVHQMRVGCRRLRSDLRTFAPLLEPEWAGQLRQELSWLAGVLGGARDAEVLRARLRGTASADPLMPPDPAAIARIDADLAARQDDALAELDEALAGERYLRLVETLVAAAREPQLTDAARGRAAKVLPRLVSRPWRQFAYGARGVDGAADLRQDSPDARWHAVRIRGKRARYAVEAVAGAVGGQAPRLAEALGAVQDLLGEHQDAAVAAETWLSVALSDPEDHALAVTAGRLFERERAAVRAARAGFPDAWRAASRRRLVAWLP